MNLWIPRGRGPSIIKVEIFLRVSYGLKSQSVVSCMYKQMALSTVKIIFSFLMIRCSALYCVGRVEEEMKEKIVSLVTVNYK